MAYCQTCRRSFLREDHNWQYGCLSRREVNISCDTNGGNTCDGHEECVPAIGLVDIDRIGYVKIERDKFFFGCDHGHHGVDWQEIPKYLYDALIKFDDSGVDG